MSADLIHGYKLHFLATQVAKKCKTQTQYCEYLQKTITLIISIAFISR